MAILSTVGTIAGWTVTTRDRVTSPNDQQNNTAGVLTKGPAYFEFVNGPADVVSRACSAVITAFANIGAQTSLGDPSSPLVATAGNGPGPYTRSVQITPGTPVPAGRAAVIKGSGVFRLKLAGGGTIDAGDGTSLAPLAILNVSIVDADLTSASSGATVTVLY